MTEGFNSQPRLRTVKVLPRLLEGCGNRDMLGGESLMWFLLWKPLLSENRRISTNVRRFQI